MTIPKDLNLTTLKPMIDHKMFHHAVEHWLAWLDNPALHTEVYPDSKVVFVPVPFEQTPTALKMGKGTAGINSMTRDYLETFCSNAGMSRRAWAKFPDAMTEMMKFVEKNGRELFQEITYK